MFALCGPFQAPCNSYATSRGPLAFTLGIVGINFRASSKETFHCFHYICKMTEHKAKMCPGFLFCFHFQVPFLGLDNCPSVPLMVALHWKTQASPQGMAAFWYWEELGWGATSTIDSNRTRLRHELVLGLTTSFSFLLVTHFLLSFLPFPLLCSAGTCQPTPGTPCRFEKLQLVDKLYPKGSSQILIWRLISAIVKV